MLKGLGISVYGESKVEFPVTVKDSRDPQSSRHAPGLCDLATCRLHYLLADRGGDLGTPVSRPRQNVEGTLVHISLNVMWRHVRQKNF